MIRSVKSNENEQFDEIPRALPR